MRAVLILALTVVPALGLSLGRNKILKPQAQSAFTIKKCEMPTNFERKVNLKAKRMPTEEEMAQPEFFGEPHIEKMYYINLEISPERRNNAVVQLNAAFGEPEKVTRWNATNTKDLKNLDPKKYSKLGLGKTAPHGTQATWYSHYFLMKNISMEKDPNAVFIVVEDDVSLKREGLKESVLCQIKQLPADWDMFKFGYFGFQLEKKSNNAFPYPSCPGEKINEDTCHQLKFNWNYMGNQAYAVRPKGAAVIVQHLEETPIMDVDGAMMPGLTWEHNTVKPIHPNTYVSLHNMVGHQKNNFGSDRTGDRGPLGHHKADFKVDMSEEASGTLDAEIIERMAKETQSLANSEEGRESSAEAFDRLNSGISNVDNADQEV